MDSGFRRNDDQNPKPGGGAGVTSSSMGFFNNPEKEAFVSKGAPIRHRLGQVLDALRLSLDTARKRAYSG